ncbi:DUF7302 family protein [Slackia heliotrinireducens]|uniref:Uncharacterized protein n=1 Tax=Slackia heliotrinireducens (strain ATCC 29202 / DSM 20476 / NCTC 11029 / RHS 1) TaxID=471855 RepID=C7N6N9_SLAHD|nr:hypothetical protein Shel_15550 [Slackia heliotrinireducens DSM 20476]
MVALTAPNGVEVEVPEHSRERLLALGYAEARTEPKPKAAPRKRPAKPKAAGGRGR